MDDEFFNQARGEGGRKDFLVGDTPPFEPFRIGVTGLEGENSVDENKVFNILGVIFGVEGGDGAAEGGAHKVDGLRDAKGLDEGVDDVGIFFIAAVGFGGFGAD